jgi:hypothetical protein
MTRLVLKAVSLVMLALLVGCGDQKGSVHGSVTLDDKPIAKGAITFVSVEGELIREGAVIEDGKFSLRVPLPPGKYKIQLNAQRVTGTRKQLGFDGKEEVLTLSEELFPERFNTNTELTEVIKPGNNTITLNLKSKN